MFEEDVTISKQTLRVELYTLRRPSGQQFYNMVMLFFKPFPQNTQWATILEHGHGLFLEYLFENTFLSGMCHYFSKVGGW